MTHEDTAFCQSFSPIQLEMRRTCRKWCALFLGGGLYALQEGSLILLVGTHGLDKDIVVIAPAGFLLIIPGITRKIIGPRLRSRWADSVIL